MGPRNAHGGTRSREAKAAWHLAVSNENMRLEGGEGRDGLAAREMGRNRKMVQKERRKERF